MKVSERSAGRRVVPDGHHRVADMWGIGFVAMAIITLLSLVLPDTGLLGSLMGGVLRDLLGKGSWVVPPSLGLIAFGLFAGHSAPRLGRLGWGLVICFVSVTGMMAVSFHGDYFDVDAVAKSGGFLGALMGWSFATLLGSARLVGLGALLGIGLVLCFNTPIRDLIHAVKGGTVAVAKAPAAKIAETRISQRNLTERTRAVVSASTMQVGSGNTVSIPSSSETQQVTPPEEAKTKRVPRFKDLNAAPEQPLLDGTLAVPKEGYNLPPMSLLAEPPVKNPRNKAEMQQNIETLEGTLEQFGIDANVVEVATGPTVTRYEIQLGPGIRVGRITSLADNIAMDLAASQVRVEAPIPGKAAIGVEVPNTVRVPVMLRELCETPEFRDSPSRLMVALGKDVSGVNRYADLTRMPHLLIGGATNSGKSIGLSTIITSLLIRNTPKDVRLVMIDPKRVELTLFDRIPHLMCPVIKDVKEAPGVLRAVWREMDRRYDLFNEAGVRNIDGWNAKATFNERMSYIVVIIDELADLMMQAAAEVETSICRLAQLARATGIHLIIATQRPSVDVITGTIKANIPSRIAFSVSSYIDSRTILDSKGAESLVGRGDMLFLPIDASKPTRIQGCYVSEEEIDAVCKFWRQQEPPQYTLEPIDVPSESGKGSSGSDEAGSDPLWEEGVRWVAERGQASTSMLQRKFSIGFQRASRLLDEMEERGIVGPRDGPRPREVLVNFEDVHTMFGGAANIPPEEIYDGRWESEDNQQP